MPDVSPRLISVPECARQLGIGKSHCYELVARRVLPSVRLGARRLIAVDDLEAFVTRLREEAQ